MDIRIVSSGREFFKVDPTLALILLEAFPDSFERIERPAPGLQPLVVKWGIKTFLSGHIAVQRSYGNTFDFFDGWPQDVKANFPDCPDNVIREYAARFAGDKNAPQFPAFQNFKKKLGIQEPKPTPLEEKQRADYAKFRHGG